MSFCSDIKNEISKIKVSSCCKLPLTYGFLLFSRSFSPKKICMQTENENTAKLYAKLLQNIYGADTVILKGGGKKETYRAIVESEADRLKILASVDFGIYDGKINRESFEKDCCSASFIRGAFLACGQISNPEVCYRADFSVRDNALALELKNILKENYIDSHISKKGNGYTVYIKRSEMITNLLTVIGASSRSMELIETIMIREVKNRTNRERNCDSSNISKTVNASIKQRKAIEFLKKSGKFDLLPEELKSAARLRLENPEFSLKQLCEASETKITVSGLNHRLNRITEIYQNAKKSN